MSKLSIYLYGESVLRKKAKPVKAVSGELRKFVDDMFETMHAANGVGLAANQVGSLQQVIVIDVSEMEETKDVKPLAMLNPRIVDKEGEAVLEEGCLSIPEIREEVERAERIRVKFMDLEFREQEIDATGMLARVMQHEIDHLNGVLFLDYLSIVKQKLLRGRLNKISRGEVQVAYPVIVGAKRIEASARAEVDEKQSAVVK